MVNQIIQLTDDNFEELVLKNTSDLIVVDFWAEWCGPCKLIAPILEEISKEFENKNLIIGKLNIDHNSLTPSRYGIRGIPTLLFFKNGELVEQQIGVLAKDELVKVLNNHLN